MSQELLYTSAPRGLKQGSRGFCTVLSTEGLATPLATALEGLSGYRPIYPPGDPKAANNPVVYSHLKLQAAGRTWNVLSRIADYGLDYSHRANKLAHHVVLERSELLAGGPANLLSTPGILRTEWMGEPQVIASKSVLREEPAPSGICQAWEQATGDAGWAGVLAESFLRDPDRLVIVLYPPGQEMLPLFREAISLLPPDRRWDVTFSTYFTGLTVGSTCVWRAMIQGSKEALESIRFVNALRLDLTRGSLPPAKGGALVEAARQGTRPNEAATRRDRDTGFESFDEADAEPASVATATNIRVDDNPSLPPRLLPSQRSGVASRPMSSGSRDDDSEAARARDHARLWYSLGVVALLIAVSIGVAIGTGRVNPDQPRPSPNEGVAVAGEEPDARSNESLMKNSEPEESIEPPADAEQPENKSEPVAVVESPAPVPAETVEPKAEPEVPRLRAPLRTKQVISMTDGPVEVISSAEIGQSLPLLLIPSWLEGVFEVTKSGTELEIKEKQNALGGPFAKIKVIASDDKPSTTIKLQVINAEAAQRLKWCGILADSKSPEVGKQPICFGSFPLEASKLPRQFGKKLAALYWPMEAPLQETGRKPMFRVARLVIAFDGVPYIFVAPNNEAAVVSELSCEQLSMDLGLQNVAPKDQITIAVSESFENKRPGLRIELASKKSEALLDRLHAQLESEFEKFEKTHIGLPLVTSFNFKGLTKKEADNSQAVEAIAEKFRKAIDDATKTASDEMVPQLSAALGDFEVLHKSAIHYRTWVERLGKVKILAARITFDLRPIKGGETVAVDVVNFDETDVGSSKTGGGKR